MVSKEALELHENTGTWAHVPRHIKDIVDICIFCSVLRILSAKSAQAQNQLLGHCVPLFFFMASILK